jgi:hypothetical protein
LIRAVKVGANEAIEKAVVPVGELLLGGIGRASKPIDKALPYLLNLGIRHLYGISAPYFDGLSF